MPLLRDIRLEEREVGVWTDGKPLYQKTFSYTPSSTISTTTPIANLSSEIEIKDIQGVCINSQNSRVIPLSYSGSNLGTNFGVSASNVLQIEIYNDSWGTNYTFYPTIQYTKTTDTAGSGIWNGQGGLAHHYSTSEKIIGTWVDGKPVYECTFYVASASLSNKEFSINTGLSNIKKVLTCTGVLTDGSETYMLPFERLTERESIRIFTRANSDNTVALNVITGVGGASVYSTVTDVYVTLTYTKTTD